jgi:hypothetical protein
MASARSVNSTVDPYSWNTKAVIAIVMSFWMTVPAVILGHIAITEIDRCPQRGRGLAVAALVLGYGAIVVYAILIVFMLAIPLLAG